MLHRTHTRLNRCSPRLRLLLAVLLTSAVTLLDLVSGPDLSFSLFYLLPIGGLAWYDGARAARLLVALSAFGWLADGLLGTLHPGVAIWNTAIRAGFFLLVIVLLARLHDAYELQRSLADRDPLTGLANLRALRAGFSRQITLASLAPSAMTLAYLDLDNFKQVNDRLGHAAGDAALHAVAGTIRALLRAGDLSARVGGDEFVLVLAGCDEAYSHEVLRRLRDGIQQRSVAEQWGISVSIGAVCLEQPPGPELIDAVLQRADTLMYRAKTMGKNRIVVEHWGDRQWLPGERAGQILDDAQDARDPAERFL